MSDDGFKTGNPFLDAWSSALVQGSEEMASKSGGGPDWTEAIPEVEDNWKLRQRQAEDWMKAVGPQMAPGGESDPLDGIAEETLRRMLDPTQFFSAGTDEVNQAIQRLVEGRERTDVYALQDHIIPPPCAKALGPLVGTDDYTELPLPGGHVGVYVCGKSQGIVGDTVFDWLIERQ